MKQLNLIGIDGKALSGIATAYEQLNQRLMPPILFSKIKYYYSEGLSSDVIIRALEKTAVRCATWEYTEGILKKLLEEGITSSYLWDKKMLFKKNKDELAKRSLGSISENKLNFMALKMTFESDLKAEQDKLQKYLNNPTPINIEVPVLSDEYKAEKKKQKERYKAEMEERERKGEPIFPPFF